MHAFPCGETPLDFVGTRRARRNTRPLEKLPNAGALDAWFREAGMIDAPEDAGEFDAALALRESIYALVTARRLGQDLPADDLDRVNAVAGRPGVVLTFAEGRLRRSGSFEQGLADLARRTLEIVGGDDGDLLRECARPECTQVYLDRSRGARREWCAMRTCGNRVKAANYRARRRDPLGV